MLVSFQTAFHKHSFLQVGEWTGRALCKLTKVLLWTQGQKSGFLTLWSTLFLTRHCESKYFLLWCFFLLVETQACRLLWSSVSGYSLDYGNCSVAKDIFLRCPWCFFLEVIEGVKDDGISQRTSFLPLLISEERLYSPAGLRHHPCPILKSPGIWAEGLPESPVYPGRVGSWDWCMVAVDPVQDWSSLQLRSLAFLPLIMFWDSIHSSVVTCPFQEPRVAR